MPVTCVVSSRDPFLVCSSSERDLLASQIAEIRKIELCLNISYLMTEV